MQAYWWRSVPNFGDRLNGLLLLQMGVSPHWAAPADAELVMVGSILEHLPAGWPGAIVGAGLLRGESIDLSAANVLALRGKLTAARAKGVPKGVVLGDPGLLMSKFVPQSVPKFDLGIIPHWSDTELAKRFPHGRIIDVRDHPAKVIAQIANCKRIISSSLHGVVVADSFGIPRQAELFARAASEGGDFKFRDYASVFDTHPHFGEMWRAPHDIVERIQEELLEVLSELLGQHRPTPPPRLPHPRRCGRRPQISLLVPFRDDGEHRTRVWHWLRRFWNYHLDSVEIVQGYDAGYPFSKAAAVNDAAARARGRVFVILDADAYTNPAVVQACADNIDAARRSGQRLWYMPYNKLYRLNEPTTLALLETGPTDRYWMPSPPPHFWCEPGKSHDYGHHFGAMMQIMPRGAFFEAGGMDPRYRGWGSEDGSFMRAVDTLYAPHELVQNDVLHLWHPRPGVAQLNTRTWIGQRVQADSRLAQRYAHATGEPAFMRGLADEHVQPRRRRWWH